MMKVSESRKIDQPFDECLNPKLSGFNDMDYVKSVCQKFYGVDVKQ
jgi:hypothetical protein